jgi:hypothetical protein
MSPVMTLMQELKALTDQDLFELHETFPPVGEMQGYSSAAKLQHAQKVSALRAECIYRSLIPA